MVIIGKVCLCSNQLSVSVASAQEHLTDYFFEQSSEKNSFEINRTSWVLTKENILKKSDNCSLDSLDFLYFIQKSDKSVIIRRNSFGSVPLYLHVNNTRRTLEFSTDLSILKKLISHNERTQIPYSQSFITRYLSGKYSFDQYNFETTYDEVFRLPPGHRVEISYGNISVESELPKNFAVNTQRSLSDFGEEFKVLFFRSIEHRLKDNSSIGAQLSGGLDSSSIVSSLYNHFGINKVDCYFITDVKKFSEDKSPYVDSNYVKLITREFGYNLHTIPTELASFEKLLELSKKLSHPITSLNLHSLLANLKLASINQNTVLFTGHDGDSIVGYGYEYLRELMLDENWKELNLQLDNWLNTDWNKIKGSNRSLSETKTVIILKAIENMVRYGQIEKARKLIISSMLHLQTTPSGFLKTIYNRVIEVISNRLTTQLQPILHKQTKTKGFTNIIFNLHYPSEIQNNANIMPLEEYYQLGNHYNIKIESPYFDYKIHELCKSTPLAYLFYNGLGRGIVREGLRDILPEYIRNRANKTTSSRDFKQLLPSVFDKLLQTTQTNDLLWDYLDREAIEYNLKQIKSRDQINSSSIFKLYLQLNMALQLQAWIKTHSN